MRTQRHARHRRSRHVVVRPRSVCVRHVGVGCTEARHCRLSAQVAALGQCGRLSRCRRKLVLRGDDDDAAPVRSRLEDGAAPGQRLV